MSDAPETRPDLEPEPTTEELLKLTVAELRSEVKALRKQFASLESFFRNTTVAGRVRRTIGTLLGARLHSLYHYNPRKMVLHPKYYRPIPLADPPLISIVTPSFNQGPFLEETIKSVLDQGYPRLEYVVQDGGSKDNSAKVIEKYRDRLTHAESRRDRGQGHAINLGFAHATKGELMAYLNSDDLLLPGSLHYVASYFNKHPDVDVVYGHRIVINEGSREIARWVLPGHSDTMLTWADYIPQETMFWRRRIWDKSGGKIDESFKFALDWDLILRFRAAGAKFVRLPRFLGAFRVHTQSKTSADLATTGEPEMELLRERCHGYITTRDEIRKNMRGYMLCHVWHNLLYRLGIAHQ